MQATKKDRVKLQLWFNGRDITIHHVSTAKCSQLDPDNLRELTNAASASSRENLTVVTLKVKDIPQDKRRGAISIELDMALSIIIAEVREQLGIDSVFWFDIEYMVDLGAEAEQSILRCAHLNDITNQYFAIVDKITLIEQKLSHPAYDNLDVSNLTIEHERLQQKAEQLKCQIAS